MKGAGDPGAEALAALLAAPQDMPGPWAGLTSLDLRCRPCVLVRAYACVGERVRNSERGAGLHFYACVGLCVCVRACP
jgi:hypothetical protein